jgi:hypothetical protein
VNICKETVALLYSGITLQQDRENVKDREKISHVISQSPLRSENNQWKKEKKKKGKETSFLLLCSPFIIQFASTRFLLPSIVYGLRAARQRHTHRAL